MNILIAFECSGALRSRFMDAGHNAWSCDLKPSEDNSEHHVQMDAALVMGSATTYCNGSGNRWDLIIMHPPCTALTVAGNHVYAKGKPKHDDRLKAIHWVTLMWSRATRFADRVAMENPQGVLSTGFRRPDQYIQPYQFGDDASKNTGLWLHNLPKLEETTRCAGRLVNGVERWANQTDSGQNKLGPSPERATERARTYAGIASAIVDQWGELA